MEKVLLKKPDTLRTRTIKKIALYEVVLDTHEPKTSGCKSKCPTKCASCREG